MHTNAVLRNPTTYEAINPEDFGLPRHIDVAHRLVGRNAIRNRANGLGIHLADDTLRQVTAQVKSLADTRQISEDDVDRMLGEAVPAD